ncbi:hypothetical protein ACHAWF_001535 [Thalassiosira exigua]
MNAVVLLSGLAIAAAEQVACTPNDVNDTGLLLPRADPTKRMKSPDCPGEGYCGRTEVSKDAPYVCCLDAGEPMGGLTIELVDEPEDSNVKLSNFTSSSTFLRYIDRHVGYVCTGLPTGAWCNTDERYLYPDTDSHDLCASGSCGMDGKCLVSKQPAGSDCWPINRSDGPPMSNGCESTVCARRDFRSGSVCCSSEDDVAKVMDDGVSRYICLGLAKGGGHCYGHGSICMSGRCNADGRCEGLGLEAGEPCDGNHADCKSNICGLEGCIEEKLSDGSPCLDYTTCTSGGCGARSRGELVSHFDGLQFNMTKQVAEAKAKYFQSDSWPYVCCPEREWYIENGQIWAFADICGRDPNSESGSTSNGMDLSILGFVSIASMLIL